MNTSTNAQAPIRAPMHPGVTPGNPSNVLSSVYTSGIPHTSSIPVANNLRIQAIYRGKPNGTLDYTRPGYEHIASSGEGPSNGQTANNPALNSGPATHGKLSGNWSNCHTVLHDAAHNPFLSVVFTPGDQYSKPEALFYQSRSGGLLSFAEWLEMTHGNRTLVQFMTFFADYASYAHRTRTERVLDIISVSSIPPNTNATHVGAPALHGVNHISDTAATGSSTNMATPNHQNIYKAGSNGTSSQATVARSQLLAAQLRQHQMTQLGGKQQPVLTTETHPVLNPTLQGSQNNTSVIATSLPGARGGVEKTSPPTTGLATSHGNSNTPNPVSAPVEPITIVASTTQTIVRTDAANAAPSQQPSTKTTSVQIPRPSASKLRKAPAGRKRTAAQAGFVEK